MSSWLKRSPYYVNRNRSAPYRFRQAMYRDVIITHTWEPREYFNQRVDPYLSPCHCGDGTFDHDWEWHSDWSGDPGVVNGTYDCGYWECSVCGYQDPDKEPPQYDGLRG